MVHPLRDLLLERVPSHHLLVDLDSESRSFVRADDAALGLDGEAFPDNLRVVRREEAAHISVQPLDFVRLPFAAALGWIVFGEGSDLWTWIGAAIIFAAASYVLRMERR